MKIEEYEEDSFDSYEKKDIDIYIREINQKINNRIAQSPLSLIGMIKDSICFFHPNTISAKVVPVNISSLNENKGILIDNKFLIMRNFNKEICFDLYTVNFDWHSWDQMTLVNKIDNLNFIELLENLAIKMAKDKLHNNIDMFYEV